MGRRRVISTASRRSSAGPVRTFVLTLAVGLLVGLLVGFFLGRIVGGGREQAAPPTPPARTVRTEKTVRAPEKTIEKTVGGTEKAVPATTVSATASP